MIHKNVLPYNRGIIEINLGNGDDFNMYSGLDELIQINAINLTDLERHNFIKLCTICPNLVVRSDMLVGKSTVKE